MNPTFIPCKILPQPWVWTGENIGIYRLQDSWPRVAVSCIRQEGPRIYAYDDDYARLFCDVWQGTVEEAMQWVETMIAIGAYK